MVYLIYIVYIFSKYIIVFKGVSNNISLSKKCGMNLGDKTIEKKKPNLYYKRNLNLRIFFLSSAI